MRAEYESVFVDLTEFCYKVDERCGELEGREYF